MEHLPVEVLGQLIQYMAWLLIVTTGAVVCLLIWIGKAVIKRLTGIELQLIKTNEVLSVIEGDFQREIAELDRRKTSEITALDRRVTIVETRCENTHSVRTQ